MAAASVFPSMCNTNLLNPDLWSYIKIVGKLGKVKKIDKAINLAKKAKQASRKVDKHLKIGKKAVRHVKKIHRVAKQVHQIVST
jgi:hypothetical protein